MDFFLGGALAQFILNLYLIYLINKLRTKVEKQGQEIKKLENINLD